jgi:alkylhydroperoxidase family enzyme
VEAIIADYRSAPMDDKLRGLLDWCVSLTLRPASHTEADVLHLRQLGWADPEISAACFVTSYFNFINRVADGLGVDLEHAMEEMPALPPCPWTA